MTLQQKFLLVVSMLGLALVGTLVAASVAFGLLQRELATPFAETASVLDALRVIKRSAEEQARIVYAEGVQEGPGEDGRGGAAPGIRGPRGAPQAYIPDSSNIAKFRECQERARAQVEVINSNDAFVTRIGVGTWRNLRTRVETVGVEGETWFGDAPERPRAERDAAHARAGLMCYTIHELVEETERQVLAAAKEAVAFGEHVRSLLRLWLFSVFAVGILGGALSLALMRRWVQKPVKALREAAARIARGDLQHRVPVFQRDELGLLSAEVNHMAEMVRVMQDERVERERLAAIGEMVRRIVHNVRNPLAGIRGLAEVTRLDFEKDSPARENMDMIVSTVDTFERWLTELLDTTSSTSIHPRETPVADWISGVVEIHRSQAAARGITLVLDASGAPKTAVFDPKHLDHAVSALLSNAIEATPADGRVWITVSAPSELPTPPLPSIPLASPTATAPDAPDGHAGRGWRIEVVDGGKGIDPEVLPRIFEAQFTTKRHGTGLGLAMAQQIIRGHGGQISVRNGDPTHPEREGACFTIHLPR